MEVAREVCPGFTLEEEQKPVIADVFNWCMMLPGRLDPAKGLWLWGTIGSGKSTLLRIVNRFCSEVRPEEVIGYERWELPFCIYVRSALDVCAAYAEKGTQALIEAARVGRLGLDDVGAEVPITAHYGTPCNVIADLLLRRYDLRHRCQTFVTTNLKPSQIGETYTARVFDRCGEMFNFVQFSGYTHRPEIPKTE